MMYDDTHACVEIILVNHKIDISSSVTVQLTIISRIIKTICKDKYILSLSRHLGVASPACSVVHIYIYSSECMCVRVCV